MQRRLVRNTHNEVFGGVCSGIANYFGWDPTWVRVGAALSIIFFAGTPILVYIIMWIVIPADTTVYPPTTWVPSEYQAGYSEGYHQGYDQGWTQNQENHPSEPNSWTSTPN